MHIYFFWKAALLYSWFKEKGKSSLGVTALFFPHIILHIFLQIKEYMSFISIPLYLYHLNYQIREHLHRFGNCFMNLWGIWLDFVSLLFDYFEWNPYEFKPLMLLFIWEAHYFTSLDILHLLNTEVLCSNFNLLWCEFCMFD